jgi:hypothetical protein
MFVAPVKPGILLLMHFVRDSEATAPPEFPPDQPEVDALPDDEAAYGADEPEEEGPEIVEAGPAVTEGEDVEMDGTEEPAATKAEVDNDDAASEVSRLFRLMCIKNFHKIGG